MSPFPDDDDFDAEENKDVVSQHARMLSVEIANRIHPSLDFFEGHLEEVKEYALVTIAQLEEVKLFLNISVKKKKSARNEREHNVFSEKKKKSKEQQQQQYQQQHQVGQFDQAWAELSDTTSTTKAKVDMRVEDVVCVCVRAR